MIKLLLWTAWADSRNKFAKADDIIKLKQGGKRKMEKMIKKMKKSMFMFCAGLLLLGWLFCAELPGRDARRRYRQKVSSRTKRKAAAAYRGVYGWSRFYLVLHIGCGQRRNEGTGAWI